MLATRVITDHGSVTGLLDDDHTQYALLAGRAGGQTLQGGTAANDDVTIHGTSHATKTTSYVILQPTGGNVGVATTAPRTRFSVLSTENSRVDIGMSYTDSATAPTSIANASYLHFGAQEFNANSYRLLTFGYRNIGTTVNFPCFIGYQETSASGSTKGDLILGTRPGITDVAPTERLRINDAGLFTIWDGGNFVVGTTTGSQLATATTQKIAFYGSTPIVQPANTLSTRQALINLGLLATGGAAGLEQKKTVQQIVFDFATDLATGDGKGYFHIPPSLAGLNLVYCHARVITAGTTGTTDIQIHNVTQAADMLSTKLTIDSTETGSNTAAVAAVIDTANDDVAENDLLRIDVDAVSTTKPKGLLITLGFE